ncbi:hypothetical protein EJ05DRAFT_115053 [Pseudovirgaria hyperparasitica]|uniref:Uncharacterized protein n=1 Tax=Pseudovirgaria hyperparasitica TaxID=470096 RepID=A0A6A6W2G7_9PEZI|nr:uncharacterized protein EJ05DRAFT_115053 [Pseudovirgaria hyperparasitica]KAF2755787.1 hypothetical protein EJ05DRAFT_115053 [Pseudovirgaria hyperparasitica]
MTGFILLHRQQGIFLDFLDSLTRQGLYQTPLYLKALDSVAFASLAKQIKDENLLYKARVAHGATLRFLNEALQDPVQATKDSTLASVILLSLYEVIVRESVRPSLWEIHHDGWMLIIKLRGPEQFDTYVGQSMVRYIFSHLQAACLSKSLRPSFVPVFNHNPKFPISVFSDTAIRVTNYCAKAQELKMSLHEPITIELLDHVNAAVELEAELDKFPYLMVNKRSYRTVTIAPAQQRTLPLAYPDWLNSYHVYSDFRMAGIWNFWRCSRVFVKDAILKCVTRLKAMGGLGQEGMLNELISLPTANMEDYADGILASVPYLLGQLSPIEERKPCPYPPPIGSYFILWPFQVLLLRANLDAHRIEFMHSVLKYIRDVPGLGQADVILSFTSNYNKQNPMASLQTAVNEATRSLSAL